MRSQPTAKPHTRPVWPAPLAGVIALILYARTLAPGLTWAHHAADGGDLLAAALVGGVPHPSGYPTYQLLLRAAIALFPGEPARAGNWLSALCAAAAVGLFADLAGRMLARMVSITPALSAVAALAAALTWAVSPTFWGQAVVTEVYTLNALAVVALLWLLWRWREAIDAGARGSAWLAGAGAVLGFGLGNHLSLLLMLPGAATWLWDGRKPAGGSLGRGLLAALGAAVVALGVYAYLPLMAAATPPVNWEDPRTLQALWALVSGRLYRGLIFGLPAEHLPDRLLAWASEVVRQFGGPWAALLALAGLWRLDRRLHAWWQTTGLIALTYSVYAIAYNSPDSFVYLIPAWCVMALWLAAGLDWLLGGVTGWLDRTGDPAPDAAVSVHESDTNRRTVRGTIRVFVGKFVDGRADLFRLALIALILGVPVIAAARAWHESDLSRDREAQAFVSRALADAAPDAILLTSGDSATFALWYAVYGLGQRPDVAPVNVNLLAFDWYRRALAERHPDFAGALRTFDPAQREAALAALAAQRPLYRAEALSVPLPGFDEQPEGALVRLTRHNNE